MDENGVDVGTGTFRAPVASISIGAKDATLSYSVYTDGLSTSLGTVESIGGKIIVFFDGHSDSFTQSGSTFVSTEGNGATLTGGGTNYRYVSADGTVATFVTDTGNYFNSVKATLRTVVYPDGSSKTVNFKRQQICSGDWIGNTCDGSTSTYAQRIQSVISSFGYQLWFDYASSATKVDSNNLPDWSRVSAVTAINNTQMVCNDTAATCAITGTWPKLTFPSEGTVIDAAGRTTTFDAQSVNYPGGASITATYVNGRIGTVTNRGVARTYSYADTTSDRTTTVTDPAGKQRVYVVDFASSRLKSFRDEASRTTSYLYDTAGRVTEITYPEGNKLKYTYDGRGNLTETRAASKTPGTPPDLVTSATYASSCAANDWSCNKPLTTTDARGAVTNYTWDATHGGVTSITAPAPTSGAVRPQTRFTYAQRSAYYRTPSSPSSLVAGPAMYRLTAVSQCMTAASCSGSSGETRSTIDYGPQNGTANNLLPVSSTVAAGDGSVSATTAATYDVVGNALTLDGPLAGSADTVRARYDGLRRVVGVVSPNPGNGQPNRAQRITYATNGAVEKTEAGTVTDQSDSAWSNFSSIQQATSQFDTVGRKTSDRIEAGGQIYAVTQYSYDGLGRLDCSAVRMNTATFGNLPGACTLGTSGSQGEDRISRVTYTPAGETSTVTTAYGTITASTETVAYTSNGKVATVADANGNVTAYAYDGFDRSWRTCFQTTSTAACAGSPADYEQLTLDLNGNVTQRRTRDNQILGYGYDALNRLTSFSKPSGSTVYWDTNRAYTYDLQGRITQASDSNGRILTFGYDALGRKTSQGDNWYGFGSATFQYDAAGRRTRLTWNDGNYVSYDYLTTGEMNTIRNSAGSALVTFGYDGLGRRTSLSRANGTVTSYAYDPASRLQSLTQDLASTGYDLTASFSYNPAGQIASRTGSNDAYAWTGHYNVDRGYGVNGLNQLTSAGSVSLGYDGRGNLTSSGSTSYTYRATNEMAVAAGVSLAHDPLGRLFNSTNDGGVNTTFALDGGDVIAEVDGYSNAVLRRYVYGPGTDEPLIWYEGAGFTDRRFLHADERGSIVAVTNDAGNALAINRYDEYGIPQSGNLGRFQYTGQKWIPNIGLYDYKARMYSPTLGRFMQSDPIGYGAGINWYNYVGSDPVNQRDPSGLDPDVAVLAPCAGGPSFVAYVGGVCYYDRGFSDFQYADRATRGRSNSESSSDPTPYEAPQSPQCPTGNYMQLSVGATFNLSLISPGFSLGFSVTLSKPAGGFGNGGWRGLQVGLTGQATGTLGLGAYAGVGMSGGANPASGPMVSGTSSSRYFEAEGGWGTAAGVSANLPSDGSPSSGSYALPKVGPGQGFGAYAGYGKSWSGTLASPTLGCR